VNLPAESLPEPLNPDDPAWLRWPRQVWEHRAWLRGSPSGLQLLEWLHDPGKYQAVLGRAGYRRALQALMAAAEPQDCEAAGFAFDRATPGWGRWAGEALQIEWQLSPDGQHRAVLWAEDGWPGALLWLDGQPCPGWGEEPPGTCATSGRWVDACHFAVEVPGPPEHPGQLPLPGAPLGAVLGLLLIDARSGDHIVLQPTAHEHWEAPWLSQDGGRWRLHPDRVSCEQGLPPVREWVGHTPLQSH